MEYKDKIRQLLKRSRLRNTSVRFKNFKKEGKTYTYTVKVSVADLLDSRDFLSYVNFNKKVRKFNYLASKEITYANIRLKEMYSNTNSTTLVVRFKEDERI